MSLRSIAVLIILHLLVYATAWAVFGAPAPAWALPLAALLVWISVHDFRHFEIPDLATLSLGAFAVAWVAAGQGVGWSEALASAVFWFGVFWGLSRYFEYRSGRVGLGFGDVKLMVPIGALSGVTGTIYVVGIASLAGIVVLLHRRWSDAVAEDRLPFAPFLCYPAWVIWMALA